MSAEKELILSEQRKPIDCPNCPRTQLEVIPLPIKKELDFDLWCPTCSTRWSEHNRQEDWPYGYCFLPVVSESVRKTEFPRKMRTISWLDQDYLKAIQTTFSLSAAKVTLSQLDVDRSDLHSLFSLSASLSCGIEGFLEELDNLYSFVMYDDEFMRPPLLQQLKQSQITLDHCPLECESLREEAQQESRVFVPIAIERLSNWFTEQIGKIQNPTRQTQLLSQSEKIFGSLHKPLSWQAKTSWEHFVDYLQEKKMRSGISYDQLNASLSIPSLASLVLKTIAQHHVDIEALQLDTDFLLQASYSKRIPLDHPVEWQYYWTHCVRHGDRLKHDDSLRESDAYFVVCTDPHLVAPSCWSLYPAEGEYGYNLPAPLAPAPMSYIESCAMAGHRGLFISDLSSILHSPVGQLINEHVQKLKQQFEAKEVTDDEELVVCHELFVLNQNRVTYGLMLEEGEDILVTISPSNSAKSAYGEATGEPFICEY